MTAAAADAEASQFRWYLGGQAAWFASFGAQMIVFPWLVAVVLHEPAHRVGIAQTATMLPAIVFLLLGGAVADRGDCRGLLVRYHVLAALPPLALAAVVATDTLIYPLLIVYALAAGTLSAFVVPARDALLTRVVLSRRERAIAVASATQFVCQVAGIVAAGRAHAVGAAGVLAGQAVVLILGAVAVARLRPAPGRDGGGGRLSAMRDGLREVWHSERVRPVVLATLAVGVLYGGAFSVLLPLIARDVYGGGSAELALVNGAFWVGTIAATLVQVATGALRHPGRFVVGAMALGVGVLAAMALAVPLWGFALLCFAWGVGAGVMLTQSRTIVQLATPASHRARALAIFQLGFTGGAPFGALALGFAAGMTGPRAAVVYPAAAMALVVVLLLARTALWRHARGSPESGRVLA